jgi:MoaA/NifB/PqqE/SkfB family radical SAM enzyme
MENLEKWSKELYFYEKENKKHLMKKEKSITKKGVMWLGQTCNLKCYFCYFLDKIQDRQHPEHPFMSLEKAKKICYTLRYVYGNTSIDIQGGEPTIHPDILELISYCNEIGLKPTLITNGLVLADYERAKKFKEAGIKDFLVSVHGIGETYNRIVGVTNGSSKQLMALKNLQKLEIPIRLNCTMVTEALEQFERIAQIAIDCNVEAVNFITFNPFVDQGGRRDVNNVPKYSDISKYLEPVINRLEEANIEVNVRYFPLCMLNEKYRKNIYDFQQLPYDHNEWDYNSWTWTDRFNQRSNSENLDKPVPILMYNINNYNDISFEKESLFGTPQHGLYEINLQEHLLKLFSADIPKEYLYKQNAKLRAEKHCNYKFGEVCNSCDAKDICDGFHSDYTEVFGLDEAKPIKIGEKIEDPKYYIKEQLKVIND